MREKIINTLCINVCFCSSARPPPPNFNVDCALLGDGCLKINTPFCNGPTNYETTLKLGGTGGNKNKEDNKIKRSVIFSRTGMGIWFAMCRLGRV